jgi:hypothetical protein
MQSKYLVYPIGRFQPPAQINEQDISSFIERIKMMGIKLISVLNQHPNMDWTQSYRPGSWTYVQLVHHLSDSHMNAFIRFKWTLTEDNPLIKAYDENAWAQLPDAHGPMEDAVHLLHALHHKWSILMEGMTREQWNRTYVHPEGLQTRSLALTSALYAWHGDHHLAQMEQGIKLIDEQ